MKRMFLSMLAAVTLFASCSQEDVVSQQQANGEESLVSFTVTTPLLGSRAADTEFNGDGKLATDLYYAVYDETIGEIVEPISVNDNDVNETKKETIAVGTAKTIQLPLLNGHKYSLIFWAENEKCPYTVNWEEKTITLDAAATLQSNQEAYDAFYAYVEPFVVTGHKTETVTLYRPFAQVNIATSEGDLERVVEYYGLDEITSTQIVVTTPTAMDLTTGNAYDEKELTYTMEVFASLDPKEGLFPKVIDETIDIAYEAISLNYLLVSAEKQLVDIKMSCNSGAELDKEFKNVPVQRNYHTNIYGNLYTSQSVWNVVIEPEFEGALEPADQLAAVFENGGEVTLYTDVTLTEPLVLKDGKEVTINLNGQTIDAKQDAFLVNGGTLNIKGDGEVKTPDVSYYYTLFIDGQNAEVNIYGGTYSIGLDNVAGNTTISVCNSAVYTKNGGKANIYGGTFQVVTSQTVPSGVNEAHFLLNKKDAGGTDAGGDITVYGGTFVKFNPADNKAEGENTNFVADGYSSVQVGDNYVVAKGTAVADATGLKTALADATTDATITLVADLALSGESLLLTGSKKVTIDLGTYTLKAGKEYNSEPGLTGSDISALTIDGGAELIISGEGTIQGADYGIYAKKGTLTIKGGNFKAGTSAVQVGEGTVNIEGGSFSNSDSDKRYLINCLDANYKNNTAKVNITGGTFYMFDPADNPSEGTGTNYVPTGYQSLPDANNEWYTVVAE